MIAFADAGRAKAIEIANIYRRSGMYMEMSLLGEDIQKNMQYAHAKNMTHVLYFINSRDMKVISLADEMGGFTVDIAVEELILPKEEEEQ